MSLAVFDTLFEFWTTRMSRRINKANNPFALLLVISPHSKSNNNLHLTRWPLVLAKVSCKFLHSKLKCWLTFVFQNDPNNKSGHELTWEFAFESRQTGRQNENTKVLKIGLEHELWHRHSKKLRGRQMTTDWECSLHFCCCLFVTPVERRYS